MSLSSESQLRYIIQWFEEWSELQRSDFLPILAEKIMNKGIYVNGIVNSMASIDCNEKPLNLFQCRTKLFNEWYPTWSTEEKDRLITSLTNIDESFAKDLEEEIAGTRIQDTGLPCYIEEFNKQNQENEIKEDDEEKIEIINESHEEQEINENVLIKNDSSEKIDDSSNESNESTKNDDEIGTLKENSVNIEIVATS